MNNSGVYGIAPPDEQRFALLYRAWEMGETFWDTGEMPPSSHLNQLRECPLTIATRLS